MPSKKYKPEWAAEARELCEMEGYTDVELCEHFKISKPSYYRYKREYEEFREAVNSGKDIFDTQIIEASLRARASGMTLKDERDGRVTTKEIPPDTVACIFWLKNRNPDRWRDKQEILHDVHKVSVIDLTGEDANTD